jgi:peptidoglycan/LPS O-acetylase OafA/YrhL
MLTSQSENATSTPRRLWADVVRVAAVLLIFLFHFMPDWAISRGTSPSAVGRFIAEHFAEWGIAAFVVLSGFALALSIDAGSRPYGRYVAHRLTRILGPFWTVALPFAAAGFALGEQTWRNLWKLPVWLLGLGFVSPTTYQPISEAWWYVSLALQISLLMPLLMWVRKRWGLVPLTIGAVALNAAMLAVVELIRPDWVHLAQGFVPCRLAELALGIAAADLARNSDAVWRVRDVRTAALGCLVLLMAMSPVLDLLGAWTTWPPFLVLGVVFTVGALFGSRPRVMTIKARWLTWAAGISYCFYLTHAPVSKYAGRLLARLGLEMTLIALPVVLCVCIFAAWLFDLAVRRWVTPRLSVLFDRAFVRKPREAAPSVIE